MTRHFVFTHNNYEDTKLEDELDCRYIIYGKEIAPTTGTPHLQGFVSFWSAKTPSAAKKCLPGCFVEPAKGTPEQATAYCKKSGDITERGTPVRSSKEEGGDSKKRDYWGVQLKLASEGKFGDCDPRLQLCNFKALKGAFTRKCATLVLTDTEEQMHWWWGPTGTGKSRTARELWPGAYLKPSNNKWWDGYNGEETVLMEDMDVKFDYMAFHLKIWLDRYPFRAEVKGGETGVIRPRRFIITSNWQPEEIWKDTSDLEPLLRRLTLREFGGQDTTFETLRANRTTTSVIHE